MSTDSPQDDFPPKDVSSSSRSSSAPSDADTPTGKQASQRSSRLQEQDEDEWDAGNLADDDSDDYWGDSWSPISPSQKSDSTGSDSDHQSVDESDISSPSNADTQKTQENIATIDDMVVYLDGQLDPESRQQLEQRLLSDEQARQHLADLQKSWDALDALPRANCGQSFTESTVKLVVRDAIIKRDKKSTWRVPMLWLAGFVAALSCLGIGFIVAHQWVTWEDRQLLQQMDLIQNWEKYQAIGDMDLLERLEEEKFFAQELPGESE